MPADTIKIELEDHIRWGFGAQSRESASGGGIATLPGWGFGRAATQFEGESGYYQVVIHYHDLAGAAGLSLRIGDGRARIRLDEDHDGDEPSSANAVSEVIFDEVWIDNGARVALWANSRGLDPAAVDFIDFIPVTVDDTPPQDDDTPPPLEWPEDFGDFEMEVFNLTNDFRVENGLLPLELSFDLSRAAEDHSIDMADNDFFSHTSSNGDKLGTRLRDAGYDYTTAGENIAAGYQTPEAVVDGWINSSGHRANMLNPNFTHLGVGYVLDTDGVGYGKYWTQNFGAGDSDDPQTGAEFA
ncbi:MAG: CAP domain-containing protein [Pikeienuella sp.]